MRTRLWRVAAAAALTAVGAAGIPAAASAGQSGSGTRGRVRLPHFGASGPSTLSGVTASGPADAWVVGGRVEPGGPTQTSLTAHRDGRRWRPVRSPGVGSLTAALSTDPVPTPVAAWYTDGVWREEAPPIGSPVILHRCAGAAPNWSVVDPPVTDPGHLRDVEVVPGTTKALAVGHTGVTGDDDRHLVPGYRLP